MAKWYLVKFTVSGVTQFPLDMLRYDACFPYRSEDAASIGYSLEGSNPGAVDVLLARWTSNKHWRPTEGRWQSFVWSVNPANIEVHEAG